ncbi:hypothetical protein DFJ77DRAFT_507933 [Powellomyces hirtus]|nr:hypothetical protein DFJ77DRAFT_507933 [Powellomyces hirtus]
MYELLCIARATTRIVPATVARPAFNVYTKFTATNASSSAPTPARPVFPDSPDSKPTLPPLNTTQALMKQSAIQILDLKGVVKHFELLKSDETLPYRMKRHQEIFSTGDYFTMQFYASPQTKQTLSKSLDFDERVIRHTIMKIGESMSEITGYTLPENVV